MTAAPSSRVADPGVSPLRMGRRSSRIGARPVAERRARRLGARLVLLSLVLAFAFLSAGAARAEVIELLDKTKLNAKIIHYYDGVYTVETGGGTVKLPREKIKAITFQLPPPRAELSSAEKTFERWRKALHEGDIERVVDCYALMYQGMLATQMGLQGGQLADELKKMQKQLEGTKFSIKSSAVKGDTATLKVQRQKGEESETGEIAFVRENGEWKMLPPQ